MTKKVLPVLCLVALFSLSSCQTPGVVSKDPVVDAEKATQLAETTFNTLFTIEKQNHDLMVQYAPALHRAVDGLRVRAVPLLENARVVTKAYKANSTPDNLVTLNAVLATLGAAVKEAQTYQTQVAATKGP